MANSATNHVNSFKLIWFLQPLLIAAYPFIIMFAGNPFEISYTHLFFGIAFTTLSTLLLFFASYLFYGNTFRGILLTNIVILLFYILPLIIHSILVPISRSLFSFTILGIRIFRVQNTLAILTLITIYLSHRYIVKKLQVDFFLKALIIPVVVLSITPLAKRIVNQKNAVLEKKQLTSQLLSKKKNLLKLIKTVPDKKLLPDIYFIILDCYTSQELLYDFCNYNNQPFLNKLKTRGFKVLDESLSNFAWTLPSIASILNMEYMIKNNDGPYYFSQKNNLVTLVLKKLGYNYVDLSKSRNHDISFVNPNKKHEVSFGNKIIREFKTFITDDSCMSGAYINYWTPLYSFFEPHFAKSSRFHINKKLETLKKIPTLNNSFPKFVYAHFLIPHRPFVFDRNGNPFFIDKSKPEMENFIHGHVEATQYINKKITECVDQILKHSTIPPIIILQGDHGAKFSPIESVDRYKILNAWHWPDGEKYLYQTMSPINNFRMIFNHYFGTNLPLLKDESFCGPFGDGSFKQLRQT